jgi:hypothetical protein
MLMLDLGLRVRPLRLRSGGTGSGLGSQGYRTIEDSGGGSEGERLLRTADRQSVAGVFGLVHSTKRAALEAYRQRMDDSLQSRAAASELGPGIPDPLEGLPATRLGTHRIPLGFELRKKSVLGGLHHEYGLARGWQRDTDEVFCVAHVVVWARVAVNVYSKCM